MNRNALFEQRLASLNPAQQKAVRSIEGPVLVVAGPGSGKTEILAMRIANILRTTDALPDEILCLTFTDAAAHNMRARLLGLIGPEAYRVAIYTFHSFGTWVMNRYPEFFYDGASFIPADELKRLSVVEEILADLPHNNALRTHHPRFGFIYLFEIVARISDLKRGGVSPDEFRQILHENQRFLDQANPFITEFFAKKISKALIESQSALIQKITSDTSASLTTAAAAPLKAILLDSLRAAQHEAQERASTSPMTEWKRRYTEKNAKGEIVIKDTARMKGFQALADIYGAYRDATYAQGLFDFDDMLMETIRACEKHPELLATLQERFRYVHIDEFQDTSGVQMRMLDLLLSNPINELRPSILAVGDDDQSIFKFQGAQIENILRFAERYRDPLIVVMTDNYRSTQSILNLARGVVQQGENRLERLMPEKISKELTSRRPDQMTLVGHFEFSTHHHELVACALEINKRLSEGTKAAEIAVIAPKHRYLEFAAIVFDHFKIPVAYERKDNLLKQPAIVEILRMVRYTLGLFTDRARKGEELLSEILTAPFWGIERVLVWQISYQAECERKPWMEILLNFPDQRVRRIGEFLCELGGLAKRVPADEFLEYCIGLRDGASMRSPYRDYYVGSSDKFFTEIIADIQALLARVKAQKSRDGCAIGVDELIQMIDRYQRHGLPLTVTTLVQKESESIQLMTAHKAKGLEFDTVFVLHCQEDAWIKSRRNLKLGFPLNVRLAADADSSDDALRLFYVALTRARRELLLSSHLMTDEGKNTEPLRFLTDLGAEILPSTNPIQGLDAAVSEYSEKRIARKAPPLFVDDERKLLIQRMQGFALSATALETFLNVANDGPRRFFDRYILKLPRPDTPDFAYGRAVHSGLHQMHIEYKRGAALPSLDRLLEHVLRSLSRQRLQQRELSLYEARAKDALPNYYQRLVETLRRDDFSELKLSARLDSGIPLTGKIDRLHFLTSSEMAVYDYKTGKPMKSWKGGTDSQKMKSLKYRLQLLFYKLLVEKSAQFAKKFTVKTGVIEFVEPSDTNEIVDLTLDLDASAAGEVTTLIENLYPHLVALQQPEIEKYPKNASGIAQFISDILNDAIIWK